jgi:hypothetical protein
MHWKCRTVAFLVACAIPASDLSLASPQPGNLGGLPPTSLFVLAGTGMELCIPGAKVEGQWGIDWYAVTVTEGMNEIGNCIISFDGYGPEWSGLPVPSLRPPGSGEITKPVTRYQAPDPSQDGVLPEGEYACYGSGSQVMAGLAFRVTSGDTYTDLDGTVSGRFETSGRGVRFSGGHLDGMEGRDLNAGSFVIGEMANCEPWR